MRAPGPEGCGSRAPRKEYVGQGRRADQAERTERTRGGHGTVGFLPLTRLTTNEIRKSTTKTQKRIDAMPDAVPAIPPKPRTPAINATTRKMSAQRSMAVSEGGIRSMDAAAHQRCGRTTQAHGVPSIPA